jgi:hypothetical protein
VRAHLLVSLGVLIVVSISPNPLAGQSAATARTASAGTNWTPPRTPQGHPDLQGTWDFRTVTPLERPSEFANKAFLTAAEAAEYERRTVESRNADLNRDKTTSRGIINGTEITADVALAYNDFWWDRGTKVDASRRTSLIIDPPDGRLPALTSEASRRLAAMDVARERPAEGPEDRSVAERCILGFNSGPPMVPGGYNQNVQIVQAPGYVVLLNEMVHSARIVPLDNRPHGNLRQLVGTSRGRWEGDTLVVETKNFAGETALRGSGPNMHLIERFTRVGPDALVYQFTVTDPATWTRPWTAQISMTRTDDLIYEYACHEANYGMTNLLRAARVIEKETTVPATKSSR